MNENVPTFSSSFLVSSLGASAAAPPAAAAPAPEPAAATAPPEGTFTRVLVFYMSKKDPKTYRGELGGALGN